MKLLLLIIFSLCASLTFGQKETIDYTHFKKGLKYKGIGNYSKAIEEFNFFIKLYPESLPIIYLHRGNSYLNLNKYYKANADFERLIQFDEFAYDAYYALGYSFYSSKDYNNAINFFKKAVDLKETSLALNFLGLNKCLIGDFDDSIKSFKRSIALDSSNYQSYSNLGAAIFYNQDLDNPSNKDLNQAFFYLNKAISLAPSYYESYINRGIVYLKLGEYQNAFLDFNQCINFSPDDIRSMLLKGVSLFYLGEYAEAQKIYESCLLKDNTNTNVLEELSKIHTYHKDYQLAKQYLTKALFYSKENKYKGLINYYLAENAALQKDLPLALEHLKLAKKLGVLNDARVYKKFIDSKIFVEYKNDSKFQKFRNSLRANKKNFQFYSEELSWFRIRN